MMKRDTRIERMAMLFAVLAAQLGTAHAQYEAVSEDSAVVFIFAFVGALILSAYVASKMLRPRRKLSDEPIIPVPLPRKR